MRPFLRIATILLITAAALPAAAFAPDEVEGRMAALNGAARQAYAVGKAETMSRTDPILVVADDLIFIREGGREEVPYLPALYTVLKTVSHVALGTVSLLQPWTDDPAGAENWREPLIELRDRTRELRPLLAETGLEGKALARNEAEFDRWLAFIDRALERGSVTAAELEATARESAPTLLANGADAARIQLDALHEKVEAWRATLAPGEWERLRVLVLGPRMPRDGNLQFEYFAYAMGRDAVDRRLIYAESIFDPDQALSLLGTIVTDRSLSAAAFGDEMRMDRDFMADGAQAHLLRMFGRLGAE